MNQIIASLFLHSSLNIIANGKKGPWQVDISEVINQKKCDVQAHMGDDTH